MTVHTFTAIPLYEARAKLLVITLDDPGATTHLARTAREHFPDLRIVLAHGGWPWVSEILHVCYRRPNIWISPDMYLFGGMPGALDYVNAANGFMAERFLFASAYPVLPLPAAVRAFLAFPIRPEVAERLLYQNAARLLGLD